MFNINNNFNVFNVVNSIIYYYIFADGAGWTVLIGSLTETRPDEVEISLLTFSQSYAKATAAPALIKPKPYSWLTG